MIGTDLNLDLPDIAGGDTMAVAIAKIVVALEAVADSIAQKATPAGLDITSALEMNGNALTGASSVQLRTGNVPSTPGSIYYYGGEFYAIDATGVIQWTQNGQLSNLASGSIVGDYGQPGVSATVYYDNISEEYRFNSSAGWAKLVAKSLVLEGANGTVELNVDAAISTNRTASIKSLPASGASFLVFDAATNTIEDSATNTSAKTVAGDVTFTGNVKATEYQHDSSFVASVAIDNPAEIANGGVATGIGAPYNFVATNPSWRWQSRSHGTWGLRAGDRIKSVTVTLPVTSGGNAYTVTLQKRDASGSVTTVQAHTFDGSGGSIGAQGFAITSPAAIATGERWSIKIEGPNSGDWLTECHVSYDHP